jgi:hypothetical protein
VGSQPCCWLFKLWTLFKPEKLLFTC